MRIGFLGKGGSGKTTTAAAFILWAKKHHSHVVALDADVNVHLGKTLSLPTPPKALSESWGEIIRHVVGHRDLKNTQMINTTPPNFESAFIDPSDSNDPFFKTFASHEDGVTLLNVGTYKADDVGESCYHAKLGSLAVSLHHMLDSRNDLIVADTTAGTDNVATSMFFAYDLNVMIIEPTLRSIQVFKDFEALSSPFGIQLKAIVNKVEDQEDRDFVKEHIDVGKIIAFMPLSQNVLKIEQGQPERLHDYAEEASDQLSAIYAALQATPKDWTGYYKNLLFAHKRLHTEWYDQSLNQDASLQVQDGFSYEKAIEGFYKQNKKAAS